MEINKYNLNNSLDIDDLVLENNLSNEIKLFMKYFIVDSFTSIPYIYLNPDGTDKLLIFI